MSNKKPKTVKDVAVKPESEKPVKAKAKKSNADLQAEVENLSALLMIRDATIAKLTEEIKSYSISVDNCEMYKQQASYYKTQYEEVLEHNQSRRKSFWQRLFGGRVGR